MLKKVESIAIVTILILFIACGGGGSTPSSQPPTTFVSVAITPSISMREGESRTISVTTQNTDFTISAKTRCLELPWFKEQR